MTGVFPFLQPAPFQDHLHGADHQGSDLRRHSRLPAHFVGARLHAAHSGMQARQAERAPSSGIIVVLVASGVLVALLDAELAGIPAALLRRFQLHVPGRRRASVLRGERVAGRPGGPSRSHAEASARARRRIGGLQRLLCLAPETGWYSDVYPWAYQGLLDAVVFWR